MEFENERREPIIYPGDLRILHIFNPSSRYEAVRTLEEKHARLMQVSGFDIDKLIELFAAGYTLEPPKYEHTLSSIIDELEG